MASGLVQVGSIVYAANGQNKKVDLSTLDPENEIRSLRIQLELTLISTAGAFNVQAGDHYIIVAAVLARLKGSWNFDENACNALPDDLRHTVQDFHGADGWTESLRVGEAIPATGAPPAIIRKIPVDICFVSQADDAPNMLCMTTDQFNASAAQLMIDCGTLATNGGNLVLGGGTALVTVTDIKVLAEYGDAYGVRVGPHWTFKRYGESKDRDVDQAPGLEHLLYQRSAPATFEAVFSQAQFMIDGNARTRNVTPTSLAGDYLRTSVKRDGLRGYDLTNNALGGVGSVSPLRWKRAHIRSAEYEQPFHNVERKIEFTRTAAAAAYDFWQVKSHHVSKIRDVARRLMGAYGLSGDPADLPVFGMGGSENNSLRQFKGRIIKSRKAA